MIGVILAPLVIECAVLCHAQWSAILGKSTNARTPILDSIQRAWLIIYEELSLNIRVFHRRFSNQPTVMLTDCGHCDRRRDGRAHEVPAQFLLTHRGRLSSVRLPILRDMAEVIKWAG